MAKAVRLFTVLLLFFYVFNLVYAQDYSLYSGKFYDLKEGEEKIEFEFYEGDYNICENEKKTIPILVINEDTKTDNTYSLDAIGAGWSKLNVNEFSLPKSQKGVVFLELNPDENTDGRYNVLVNSISSVGKIKRDLSLDINVEKCYSLNLELEIEEEQVCGGIKKQYSGEIINNGKQKDELELSVQGPNWVNADKNAFSIAANDRQKFELNAELPANAKGIFNVFVKAAIRDLPSISSEKKLSIDVVPKYDCYKADVIADPKIKNDYSNAYIPIKIRNSGIKQADYEISLEAPNWISIEPKKLTVNPEQFGNLNLNINPSAETAEGNYPIKIYVKFEDIAYSKNIEIVLSRHEFLKKIGSFFVFYQYYIYVILFIIIILFIFRRQISNKIKITYKKYRIKRARLKALEAARKARAEKRAKKEIIIEEPPKPEGIKRLRKSSGMRVSEFATRSLAHRSLWILFLSGLFTVAVILLFLIYQFDFPASKEFVKNYYGYSIAGVVISLFAIFMIEFYNRKIH